jgi:hypothetical protein
MFLISVQICIPLNYSESAIFIFVYVTLLDIKIYRDEEGWNPINKNKPGAIPFQSIA